MSEPMPLLVVSMGDIANIAPEEERAPGVLLVGTREEVASWGRAGLLNCKVVPAAASSVDLIAAAPDLLALLEELVDIEGPQPGHVEWYGRVVAAIAKAKGGG